MRGGGFVSELHNAFFDGHTRLFNVKINNEDALDSILNYWFSVSNYETAAIELTQTTTILLTAKTEYIFKDNLDYGLLVLNFYYTHVPANVTCRVYCSWEEQGIGWHDLLRREYMEYSARTNGRIIFDNPYYRCSQIEITITPQESIATNLLNIEYYMRRAGSFELSAVNKTADEQNFRGKLIAGQGFAKKGSSDDQVLLGGGGTKNINELKVKESDKASALIWELYE